MRSPDKRPRAKRPPQMVLVNWLDAVTESGWQAIDEHAKAPEPVATIGYLVHSDRKCVVVASSIGGPDVNATTTIPRGMVVGKPLRLRPWRTGVKGG